MSAKSGGVALVTGGARRIGAAIVERLAAEGHGCAIHCHGSRAEAEDLATRIRAAGGRAVCLTTDLADAVALPGLVRAAADALGPLTLLVNSASVFRPDTLESVEAALIDEHHAVNVRAPVLLSRAFAEQAPDGSSIVNIVDQRVWRLTPQCFSYTLSKVALHAATVTMAQALAPRIRVNAVGPGPTLPNRQDGTAGLAHEAAGVPLRRTVDPSEIADAVAWLARAASVTGQMIAVDAGQHIAWQTPDIILP